MPGFVKAHSKHLKIIQNHYVLNGPPKMHRSAILMKEIEQKKIHLQNLVFSMCFHGDSLYMVPSYLVPASWPWHAQGGFCSPLTWEVFL